MSERESMEREKVRFTSGGTECAAWHYPGTNGACVVMAGGFAVPKEPATDLFAKRFNQAGFAVLAFDYRRLGESGGQPRLALPVRDQLDDWQAAIDFARTLPGVDSARLAVWAFSASGGHIFRVAARDPRLGAAIAQTPNADGPATARNAARHQRPLAMLRFTGRAVLDALGGLVGRPPRLVPLVGEPGTVAMLTTPDALEPAARCVRNGTRTGSRWSPPVQRFASRPTGPAGTRPGCAARCSSSSATRIRRRSSSRPSGRRSELPTESSYGYPAGITPRSWTSTSRRSRPSCPSCAGTCSNPRERIAPRPSIPYGTEKPVRH
ncbi:alpha/beta hydrolase [Microbispora hainanensis]|uniref:alpha/beta hydrolase n=1 Tax=Microbispora hainanensis TaxID=568844 RepID=UPI003248F5DC